MAQEIKKRKNMETPASKMKGIKNSNPFSLLLSPEIVKVANAVGLVVDNDVYSGAVPLLMIVFLLYPNLLIFLRTSISQSHVA